MVKAKRTVRMRTILSVVGICALFPPAGWADFDRGRALYENHCRQCHDTWAHNPGSRTVSSYEALRTRVASWSIHAALNWSAEEVDDVTRFLNRRFYQLER
jgi:hypothetical protein